MMLKLGALPKGFRFRPTDEELINHYLRQKINGYQSSVQIIPEVDVCKSEPWDLPAHSVIKSDDLEWFFFCPRDRKYPNGHRSNRATEAGYWKATGKDRTIKSRKSLPSGHSNTQLIGMKKTLVFHKGRAPKGERTNWIIHEYRATEPDLDGSGPGQGDYVLCRLFHKADDKLGISNHHEFEPPGSSSTGKSSPDDVTSDLLQEPAGPGMEIKELEDVKKQWTHEADQLTSMMQVPVGRCESNVSGHSEDKSATEAYGASLEIPKFEEPTNTILNTFQSHSYADSGACLGSPFGYDFGYDPNGLYFQDGTSEQDASLSELLKDLEYLDSYFDDDSTTQMNFVVASDALIPEQINGLEQERTGFSEASHFQIHDNSDTQIAKSQGQSSAAFVQVEPSTHHSSSQNACKEEDSFLNSLMSSNREVNNSFSDSRMIKDSSIPGTGTAIKIRSRQQRNRSSSVNTTTQGTASRRINLLMESGSNSISCEKSKPPNCTEGKKSESLIEAVKNMERNCESHDQEHGYLDKTKEIGAHDLEFPAKHIDEKASAKMVSMPSALSFRKGACLLNVYVVSVYLVIIMSVVSLGLWKCPSLSAPYD